MNITLNGETITIKPNPNINEFLDQNGYAGMLVAVARNGTFVPRSQYNETTLAEGDNIEIVSPMQGG